MKKQELDRVEALAKAATPGGWGLGRRKAGEGPWQPTIVPIEHGAPICLFDRPGRPDKDAADSAYILAVQPEWTLSTITELRRLQEEVERLKGQRPALSEGVADSLVKLKRLHADFADALEKRFDRKTNGDTVNGYNPHIRGPLQDALDLADRAFHEDVFELLEDVLPLLDAATSLPVQETQGWIAVSERLPEDSFAVLIVRPINPIYQNPVVTTGFYNGAWYAEGEDYDGDALLDNTVTHWMPLPAAPTTPTQEGV